MINIEDDVLGCVCVTTSAVYVKVNGIVSGHACTITEFISLFSPFL